MKIGIDLDGVLCDFNAGWQRLVNDITGADVSGVKPQSWDLGEAYGLTLEQVSLCWKAIAQSEDFWLTLPALWKNHGLLLQLAKASTRGDEVFFLTTRTAGVRPAQQSAAWLSGRGFPWPSVIVTRDEVQKGVVARALELDIFVDDSAPNCIAVRHLHPVCEVYLQAEAYNHGQHAAVGQLGIHIVASARDALALLLRKAA